MIVLDVTMGGVALPSIRTNLGFSEASLAWVINAYLITFGGFLLLGGRLGDLLGHRSMFLAGVAVFTAASAVCGFANSQQMLVAARAVQGIGGGGGSGGFVLPLGRAVFHPGRGGGGEGGLWFVFPCGRRRGVCVGGRPTPRTPLCL